MTDHSLADHPDQAVVLLFVPGAFTRVCTEELCTQSREIEAYEELDAVVYGITVDSAYCQAAWLAASRSSKFPDSQRRKRRLSFLRQLRRAD